MANNYLDFSEVIEDLSPEEESWLRNQLELVYVFGDREYTEETMPADLDAGDADWTGCRVYRDVPECVEYAKDTGMDCAGFAWQFETDVADRGWFRYLWVHTDEWGYVDGVAQLVKKFLKTFRPDQCWSLTYASTCSKPRVGEFSGGAVFVTADEIVHQDAYDFVQTKRTEFTRKQTPNSKET